MGLFESLNFPCACSGADPDFLKGGSPLELQLQFSLVMLHGLAVSQRPQKRKDNHNPPTIPPYL